MRVETEFGAVTLRHRSGRWYARKQHKGKRNEVLLASRQEDQAIEEARSWLGKFLRGIVDVEGEGEPTNAYIARLFRAAKRRAQSDGLSYDLTPDEERGLYIASNGRCAVSGIHFQMGRSGASYRAPFAPSLDRIDSSAGYTSANVRLVCVAVNWALSDWGEGVFRRVCVAYAAKVLREAGGDF